MAQEKLKIICDLDGTLIDPSTRHHRVYSEAVKKFDGVALDRDTYWNLKREKTTWNEIFDKSQLQEASRSAFFDYFISVIETPEYLSIDTVFPGVIETLDYLRERHHLHLITLRRSRVTLLKELENLGIKSKFEKILSGHTEGEGFEFKAKLIAGVSPISRDIVVGDTEADILMAKKLGLRSVAVSSGIRSSRFLESLEPNYLLPSFVDLREVVQDLAS